MHDNIPENCQECKITSLEWGYSFEQKEDSVKYVCFACAYDRDVHEQLSTGILRSSLASKSLIKQDWKIFKPYFELEVMMVPVFQEIWNKYKDHEILNDPNFKRAIIIDTNSNNVYSRTWGEDNKKILSNVVKDSLIIEIFDGICDYIGIDIYSAHSEHGMWVQGQLRSKESQPWYRSCYSTFDYAKAVAGKIEEFLELSKEKIALARIYIASELDRVLDNLDRAESWVRYNSDLYSDVYLSKNKKKIARYKKEYDDSVKVRDEDRKLIRDMIEFNKSKNYIIADYTLRNLKNRGLC